MTSLPRGRCRCSDLMIDLAHLQPFFVALLVRSGCCLLSRPSYLSRTIYVACSVAGDTEVDATKFSNSPPTFGSNPLALERCICSIAPRGAVAAPCCRYVHPDRCTACGLRLTRFSTFCPCRGLHLHPEHEARLSSTPFCQILYLKNLIPHILFRRSIMMPAVSLMYLQCPERYVEVRCPSPNYLCADPPDE